MKKKFKFEKTFRIRNKLIGQNNPTFIIAEIGINHLGSKRICIEMIKSAIKSGADAVKLQIIDADESYSKETMSYKIFNKFKLSFKDLTFISNFCKKQNIILFATPGDFKSLKIIKKLKMPAIKISSGLLTNLPLINEASKLKLPIILSSGMSFLSEINEALEIVYKNKNTKACLLKCTSIYPAKDVALNLLSIKKLKNQINTIVGYSDHTMDDIACLVAVSLGAKVIEKHFTTNKNLKFADNKISMEPNDFKNMVSKIRRIEKMIVFKKNLSSIEEINKRINNHRYLISSNKILKGEHFNSNNLGLKRTNKKGSKLSAKVYFKLIGKKSKYNYNKNEIIKKQ